MHATHNSPLERHPGYFKTYMKIKRRFMWKGLKTDVFIFMRECNVCQQNKAEHTHMARLLQPLPIPE
jgi:hypothetical protein